MNKIIIIFFCLIGLISQSQNQKSFRVCYSFEDALLHQNEVEILILRNNKKIKTLSKSIGELKNLRVIDVSGTNLTFLPNEISNCNKLEEIKANASKFKDIPNSIGKLQNLKIINFSYNNLQDIPKSIASCSKLERVNFSDNSIKSIPVGFGNLKNLKFCSFANNKISEFSTEFIGLIGVYNLWLHGNSINYIPIKINRMNNLTHLLIDKKEIRNLEVIEQLLPELRIIDENNRRK